MWCRNRSPACARKITYYPLALLALAGGVSALPMAGSWPLEHGYGGILGDVIFGFVASMMSFISSDTAAIAAAILLFGIGLSSLTQAAGLSARACAVRSCASRDRALPPFSA